MSGQHRLGRHQLAAIAERLSDRDRDVLGRIATLRFLRTDQICDLVFTGHASQDAALGICRRALRRLDRNGLIRRLERRVGGVEAGSAGNVYVLTAAGHRLLGTGVAGTRHEPGLRHLQHTLMGNDLIVQIELGSRTGAFDILALENEPTCWRPIEAGRLLKPDAFAHVANHNVEAAWFIEIDCGTESGTTIAGKCSAYIDYRRTRHAQDQLGFFPRIIFVTPDSNRALRLDAVLASQQLPTGLFLVVPTVQALAVITNLDDP